MHVLKKVTLAKALRASTKGSGHSSTCKEVYKAPNSTFRKNTERVPQLQDWPLLIEREDVSDSRAESPEEQRWIRYLLPGSKTRS